MFINKMLKSFLMLAMLLGAFTLGAVAQDTMKKDEMKKDEMMKKDSMKKEAMEKDEMMKKEAMEKDEMMKKDSMEKDKMMMDKLPTVAVVRADWCPYCKKIEAFMPELMKKYNGKLNFVVFDITNEETTAKSMELAKEKGLSDFFAANKGKAAHVEIIKAGKVQFTANQKTERKAYEKAFAKATK